MTQLDRLTSNFESWWADNWKTVTCDKGNALRVWQAATDNQHKQSETPESLRQARRLTMSKVRSSKASLTQGYCFDCDKGMEWGTGKPCRNGCTPECHKNAPKDGQSAKT